MLNIEAQKDDFKPGETDYIPKKQKGKRGKRLRLITNYIRVFVDNEEGIFEYKVSFYPPIDNLELRKRVLGQFDDVLKEQRVFDGVALFLPFQLTDSRIVLSGCHPNHLKVPVKVILSYVNRKGYRGNVSFFNVLLRRIMTALGKQEHRNSFFDPDVKFRLPQNKLEIWPGICTSVEEQEDGLMLCLDTSYRVFRTDTVFDYIDALSDLPNWKETFKQYILGKTVVTRYNNFTYRIDDISWEKDPTCTFDYKGKKMTYVDYYKERYRINIQHTHQPMLLSRVKVKHGRRMTEQVKVISIVPELCYVCGIDDDKFKNETYMKEVHKYTFCTPAQKIRSLTSFVRKASDIPEVRSILESWGLRLELGMLEVTGRQLPSPALQFGNKSRKLLEKVEPNFGSSIQNGVYTPIPFRRWLIICPIRDLKLVKRFQDTFIQACSSFGLTSNLTGSEVVQLKSCTVQEFREALECYADPEKFQFVIVVMPYAQKDMYSCIKRICCSERAIPSQVILSKTLVDLNSLSSTTKNIVTQINCKLGGSPWALYIPLTEKIMFVGIDVYHDVKRLEPSVVALIASLNSACTLYFSRTQTQKVHQEITDNMQPLFSEALESFAVVNGTYPDRIIVFRDGGSLSYMPHLIEYEVKPMLRSVKIACADLKHFTYLIVSKRIPQRLFVRNEGFVTHAPVGTVLDEKITYPKMFDFYIVSQMKEKSAISPTHYMVIYDKDGIKPDLLQQLAYSTTYMYFNWPGAIGVPAMIQYAHRLSSLVGRIVKKDPVTKFERLLYYL